MLDIQVEWYRGGSGGAGRSEAHAIRSLPVVYGPLRGSVEHPFAPMRPLHLKRAGDHARRSSLSGVSCGDSCGGVESVMYM